MARILYGVMGNTYGHVMRTQAIAERLMPEHEFSSSAAGGCRKRWANAGAAGACTRCRCCARFTTRAACRCRASSARSPDGWWNSPRPRELRRVIDDFQPDLAICDREFYLPIACRRAGLRCVSLDHSHVLKACRYPVPPSERLSWSLAMLNDYLLFDFTRQHLIVSFFHPPLRRRRRGRGDVDELLPPVLRPAVTAVQPGVGEHVLVYQTSATFRPLLEPLSQLKRPVIVYGYGAEREHRRGNLTFKPFDDNEILNDLATCAYAVVNGGHNLICEALHFGKPVLCFPHRAVVRAIHQRVARARARLRSVLDRPATGQGNFRGVRAGAGPFPRQPRREGGDVRRHGAGGRAGAGIGGSGREPAGRHRQVLTAFRAVRRISGNTTNRQERLARVNLRTARRAVRACRFRHRWRGRDTAGVAAPPPASPWSRRGITGRKVNQLAQARQQFFRTLFLPLVRVSFQFVHEQQRWRTGGWAFSGATAVLRPPGRAPARGGCARCRPPPRGRNLPARRAGFASAHRRTSARSRLKRCVSNAWFVGTSAHGDSKGEYIATSFCPPRQTSACRAWAWARTWRPAWVPAQGESGVSCADDGATAARADASAARTDRQRRRRYVRDFTRFRPYSAGSA